MYSYLIQDHQKKLEKQENQRQKRLIKYEKNEMIDILAIRINKELQSNTNLYNFDTKYKLIDESITEYEQKKDLFYEYEYYFYILSDQYDNILSKAIKYKKQQDFANEPIPQDYELPNYHLHKRSSNLTYLLLSIFFK